MIVSLGTRLGAIGCGTVAFCFALLMSIGAMTSLWEHKRITEGMIFGALALIGVAVGLMLFWLGIRAISEEDDDLFHGDRGTAVAVAIVVMLAFAAFAIAVVLHIDFWRGFISGFNS